MSSEWKSVSVGEVTTLVTKGTTPTSLGFSFQEGGVRFVKVESLTNEGQFLADKFAFISEDTHKALLRSQLQIDDVLFTIAGTIGRTAIVNAKVLPANTNQAIAIVRPDKDFVEPRFLRYVLSNPSFTQTAQSKTVQSVQSNFSLGELKQAKFFLPSLIEQKSILGVLGSLDDQITLLRETNETLEAIAQAIFKSWFVDFDPVKAKAAGLVPGGIDETTAALFPDSFEESIEGLIPSGWKRGTLKNLADLSAEAWSAKNHPERVAYLDLSDVKGNQISVPTEYLFDEAPSRARRVLKHGDTIVGTVRPGNGSYAFVSNPVSTLTGSTGFAVLRPKDPANKEFVYLAATQDSSIEHLAHIADGGAYPAVRPEAVAQLPCVLADQVVLSAFHDLCEPLISSISDNQEEIKTLAELRDTLLPRLISGKIKLPEQTQEAVEMA